MLRLLPHRLLLAGALMACSLLMAAGPISPFRFQEIFRRSTAAMLRVRSQVDSQQTLSSGFLIAADGALVTVLPQQGRRELYVLDDAQQTLPARLVAHHAQLGVAVLQVPSAVTLPTLALAPKSSLRTGDWVVAVSHEEISGKATAVAGCVSQIKKDNKTGLLYVIDAASAPGGPVLDMDGRVVAITLRRQGVRRAVAVAIEDVRAFLVESVAAASPSSSQTSSAPSPTPDTK